MPRPVLPCWYSNLGDVTALGLHSAGIGDPSPQASGDTKRHYNDGGGIKQVGPTLKADTEAPRTILSSGVMPYLLHHRRQAEGLTWDETLQYHSAYASWQSDISGWRFAPTASHPIEDETLVCFRWGMNLEDKIPFPYSPSLSPAGPRSLPIWSLAKSKTSKAWMRRAAGARDVSDRPPVPQPNRDPLGKVAWSL